MTKPQRLLLLVPLALLGAAVALARGSSATPSPALASRPAPAAIHPELAARAPLSFSLRARAGSSELEQIISVDIEPRGALPYPVTMEVSLPRGARLLDGERKQTLEIRSADRISRELRVSLERPLQLSDPLKVTLQGRDEVSGLHGEKQLPPLAELAPPRPVPPPPGGRPHR